MNTRRELVLLGFILLSGITPGQSYRQRWASLVQEPPKSIRSMARIGPKPLSDLLHLSIGLTCRDLTGLQGFADSVSNPKSSGYGHFITPEEVGQRFGISKSNVKKASDYLTSQGMKVRLLAKNRLAILVDATVAQAQAAFRISIDEYMIREPGSSQTEVRYAFTSPPSVPAALAPFVTVIGGLENVVRPKPLGTLTPNQLRTLYGVAPLYNGKYQGQGRTIGISNWDGYRLSNISLMYQQWNLPLPSGGVGTNVLVVPIDGQNGNTASYQGEGDIDIQCVLGMSPLCNLIIYDNATQNDLIGVLTKEADDNTADIITESYGWPEDAPTYQQTHAIHLSMTSQGITYMNASGDTGSDGITQYPYPDEEPENLVVGGTSVTTDGLGNRTGEVVWNNSLGAGGGGWTPTTDAFNTLPSWQKGNGVPTNIPYRLVPDISLDADPNSGYDIYIGGQRQDGWGGTSCASPTFAGGLADAEQQLIASGFLKKNAVGKQRMGRIQDLLYSFNGDPTVFFDVISGTNGSLPDGSQSNAGIGWDTASGWGAPNLNGLVDKILGIPTPSSFTIAPTTVIGGMAATGTLTTNLPAPSGGLAFTLTSDTPDASVPATVTMPAGATSTTFVISTFGTAVDETANLTATAGGITLSASLELTPTSLASISVNPSSVVGGNQASGTVSLTGGAALGGYDIALTSSDPSVTVPQNVEIQAGATSDTFSINTSAVSKTTAVTLTATYNGVSVSTTITVRPGGLSGLTVAPASVPGGTSAAGTVSLSGLAPPGGLTVALASNSSSAAVPATVVIPAGAGSATFPITTRAVSANTQVTLTASQAGFSNTATLTVTAAALASISASPTTVLGGNSAVGTVNLTGVAAGSGVTVTLASSIGNVVVPASVVVPPGASSVTFSIKTTAVSSSVTASITGKQGVNTQVATLTVQPPAVSSLSIAPDTIEGGTSATGTVTLNGAAGSSGVSVAIASSSVNATVPATVTVPSGATSTTFSISTTPVTTNTTASISASAGGAAQSATLTVLPPLLQSVTVSPSSVVGGNPATGTVTLSRAAPPGGVDVSLSAQGALANVPSSIMVPQGSTSANFTVSTVGVSAPSTATITASLAGTNASTSLTIQAAALVGLTIAPSAVVGGNSATGTVTLNGLAPAGGITVQLGSSSSSVIAPTSVTIQAGASSASFTVATKPVVKALTATVTANRGSAQYPVSVLLQPSGLASVSVSSSTFIGGSNEVVTGTVTFNGPAASAGAVVKLSSSDPAALALPASIKISGGKLSATFSVMHRRVSSRVAVTISATYGGVSHSVVVTLSPFQIMSFACSPTTVVGGKTSTATVTLNAAPGSGAGSIAVRLTYSSRVVTGPTSVAVLSGKPSSKVTLRTSKVATTQTVTATASIAGSSGTASLTVTH